MKKQIKKNDEFIEKLLGREQKIQDLLFGPENEIFKKQSDDFLDRHSLEIKLRDGISIISDVIMTEPRIYEPIFHKVWFYRLADMLGVNRAVMDPYVKPKYVRSFFIQFVYARLSFTVFRELKAARRLAKVHNAKLFQFLKDDYFRLIEKIAMEIYDEMEGKSYSEFVSSYCSKNKLPIQQTLFP